MTDTDSKTSETSTGEVAPVESQAPREPASESVTEAGAETVTEAGPETGAGTGAETAAESVPPAEADTVSGDVAAVEAQADTVSGDAAPDEGADSSAGGVAAEEAGKKKRRRRRKKKGAQAGASEASQDAKSAHHHAPFIHLFSGGVTRKHAFSPGEEIAGRVDRVEHGTVIIDVFGKATAIADVDEPRDIPVIAHGTEEPKPEA